MRKTRKPRKPSRSRSPARQPEAIEFAKSQRHMSNEFARIVWQWLRNRQCRGQKFRREYPIPPYTVDFCCVALKLIIEVDGESHFTPAGQSRDARRDRFLSRLGYRVFRIPGYDVLNNPHEVRPYIERVVDEAIEGMNKRGG